MKKIILTAIVLGLTFSFSGFASAHTIYNNNVLDSKGQPTIIGEIPYDVWNAVIAKAMANIGIGQTNMIHVARGAYVTLKTV